MALFSGLTRQFWKKQDLKIGLKSYQMSSHAELDQTRCAKIHHGTQRQKRENVTKSTLLLTNCVPIVKKHHYLVSHCFYPRNQSNHFLAMPEEKQKLMLIANLLFFPRGFPISSLSRIILSTKFSIQLIRSYTFIVGHNP